MGNMKRKGHRTRLLRGEQMGLLRNAVGYNRRVPEYRVLAKATALLMMYANAERVRHEEPVGFSAGPPAEGEADPDGDDDE
jgi:hypothetical protein